MARVALLALDLDCAAFADVPLLALSALDDPCVDSRGMPLGSGSEYCTFVLTECGGHLGFLMSRLDWRNESYDNVLACEWFGALMKKSE